MLSFASKHAKGCAAQILVQFEVSQSLNMSFNQVQKRYVIRVIACLHTS